MKLLILCRGCQICILLLTLSNTGCYYFFLGSDPVRLAIREGAIRPGSRIDAVRETIGEPREVEVSDDSSTWVYSGRYADGVDFSRQFYYGFLTLGIYWFLWPELARHEFFFEDGVVTSIRSEGPER